jgi:hypothetical protein
MDEVPWYRRWWLWLKLRLGIIKFKFEKMTMPQVKREFPPISTDVIESNSMKAEDPFLDEKLGEPFEVPQNVLDENEIWLEKHKPRKRNG